jgi:hypothetical protein
MSLSALKMDADVEETTDTLGGSVLDSDIYKVTIKTIYMGNSTKTNAMSATVIGTLKDGSEFKNTQWVLSGDTKGNKPYYERNGKKYPLPGYAVIDDICKLTIGKSLGDAETEENIVKIYDYESQKDVPTEVDCIADVAGHEVLLAIQKQLEDKTEEAADGTRIATGETRDTNEVSKVLDPEGATWLENKEKTEPEFAEKWLTKNKGKVRDKTSKKAGSTGAPKKSAKKAMFS